MNAEVNVVQSSGVSDTGGLEFRFVEVAHDGAIALLTINDPPANTLTHHMVAQLEAAFWELALDHTVQAVVITGAGERFFCGGVNIGMLSNVSAHHNSDFLLYAGEVFELIERSELLVVAAINGHITGGGLELALLADRRLAVVGTYNCGFPEVRLGVIPGLGGTQRLSRLVGARQAFELITQGEFIGPDKAEALGIFDRVLPRQDFLQQVLADTREVLSHMPPRRQAATRSQLQSAIQSPIQSPRRSREPLVEYQASNRVALITINECAAEASALLVLWALNAAILAARHDADTEALLITHAGARLSLGSTHSLDDATWNYAQYVLRRLEHTPRLCALAFRGALDPLATELALACDYRLTPQVEAEAVLFNVAKDSARVATSIAHEDELTLAEAQRAHLIKIIAAEPWPQSALAWLARFVTPRGASKCLGYAKLAIKTGSMFEPDAGRMLEWHLQEQLFRGHDSAEGMRAYLEKRTASFKGE